MNYLQWKPESADRNRDCHFIIRRPLSTLLRVVRWRVYETASHLVIGTRPSGDGSITDVRTVRHSKVTMRADLPSNERLPVNTGQKSCFKRYRAKRRFARSEGGPSHYKRWNS
ncbi:hypothetical protein TcasGA2_TC000283 [Tribolium castaneum]|uniref:Uncharacterized protein n=1 Tax=Tribolium castaneum TaxID=7070 RepID=D6WBC9_TRICA|nr:hypothetical protein TcasGA2_TC000283 [Tribolium castaneum]